MSSLLPTSGKAERMRTLRAAGWSLPAIARELGVGTSSVHRATKNMGAVDLTRTLKRERSLAERLWARVDSSLGDGACWPCRGANNGRGYRVVRIGGRTGYQEYAHRLAWILTHGPIPDGLVVLHACDNPPCCNPRHLRLGTYLDNARDMVAKGRQFRGEAKSVLMKRVAARGDRHWTRRAARTEKGGDDR